ncbi:hypothetical protein SAMN05216201_10948 [Pseudomonas linyingensis]|uniref:Uncharacterized protein n=1 Tax=Pseudomonas linyingensis TaxID=915471 RepID=A0A1H6YX66_9PSED|nr:hypothetical protein [Pseudomonas linyingensis]SEJ45863.1 hypothetical protein SAMN05216201_10948 [Pseudomonas linyingensis]
MPTENQSASDEILLARQVSRDTDRSYIVRCPHCSQVIGVEGDDLDEIRGEQYQHKGCGGWLEISDTAAYVPVLPESAP